MVWFFNKKKEEKEVVDTEIRTKKARITRLTNNIEKIRYELKEKKLLALQARLEEKKMDEEIAEYEDLLYEMDDDDEEAPINNFAGNNPDSLINTLLTNVLSSKMNTSQNPQPQNNGLMTPQTSETGKISYSIEQLKEFKKNIPAPQLAILKNKSDEEVAELLIAHYPQVDSDTIARAVEVVKYG